MNAHIIDNIALANLRPDKPVIPLSLLTYELKLSLERDVKAGTINLDKITEEALMTYVEKMIDHLEKVVLIKNRIRRNFPPFLGFGKLSTDFEFAEFSAVFKKWVDFRRISFS